MKNGLKLYLEKRQEEINGHLKKMLSMRQNNIPTTLFDSMKYSLLAGGKRIRPILTLAAMEAAGSDPNDGLSAACVMELIHTYSLVHDDLPAMDNDDLRRGMPTNHKVFGEAMAILAGDGLLTLAFDIMTDRELNPHIKPDRLLMAAKELAFYAGASGMVGGQSIDILESGEIMNFEDIRNMQALKTGALITCAVKIGAIIGNADTHQINKFAAYGQAIGIAFQISDDILDIEGNEEIAGKTLRKDACQGKNTYPSAIGIEKARKEMNRLLNEALSTLEEFGEKAEHLKEIACYIVSRDR